jgi:hypothetical protein
MPISDKAIKDLRLGDKAGTWSFVNRTPSTCSKMLYRRVFSEHPGLVSDENCQLTLEVIDDVRNTLGVFGPAAVALGSRRNVATL